MKTERGRKKIIIMDRTGRDSLMFPAKLFTSMQGYKENFRFHKSIKLDSLSLSEH